MCSIYSFGSLRMASQADMFWYQSLLQVQFHSMHSSSMVEEQEEDTGHLLHMETRGPGVGIIMEEAWGQERLWQLERQLGLVDICSQMLCSMALIAVRFYMFCLL
jgi:hypothetical protein